MSSADLEAISSERRLGRIYKLAPGVMALDTVSDAAIDESAMSATAIISTPTPDRVRDSMVPRGCLLDDYKNNPVVLWEHGFNLSLPIGKSEDPSGNLT